MRPALEKLAPACVINHSQLRVEESIVSKVYDALELTRSNMVVVAVNLVAYSILDLSREQGTVGFKSPSPSSEKHRKLIRLKLFTQPCWGREHSEPNLPDIALNLQL